MAKVVRLSAQEVLEADHLGVPYRQYAQHKLANTLDVLRIFRGDLVWTHPLYDELVGMDAPEWGNSRFLPTPHQD